LRSGTSCGREQDYGRYPLTPDVWADGIATSNA
jgi:hypothetical protein